MHQRLLAAEPRNPGLDASALPKLAFSPTRSAPALPVHRELHDLAREQLRRRPVRHVRGAGVHRGESDARFALEEGPNFPEELAEETKIVLKTVRNALTKLRKGSRRGFLRGPRASAAPQSRTPDPHPRSPRTVRCDALYVRFSYSRAPSLTLPERVRAPSPGPPPASARAPTPRSAPRPLTSRRSRPSPLPPCSRSSP